MSAVYTGGQVATGAVNKSIVGNKVEAVPRWLSRNLLDIIYTGISATF